MYVCVRTYMYALGMVTWAYACVLSEGAWHRPCIEIDTLIVCLYVCMYVCMCMYVCVYMRVYAQHTQIKMEHVHTCQVSAAQNHL